MINEEFPDYEVSNLGRVESLKIIKIGITYRR